MAGIKGRSGGRRVGAGRKPNPKETFFPLNDDIIDDISTEQPQINDKENIIQTMKR